MRDIITTSELEAFGFGDAQLLPPQTIHLPASDAAEAAGLRELVIGGLLALPGLAGVVSFREVDSELLRQHGISVAVLEQDNRFVRARAMEPDTPVGVIEGGESEKGHIQFDQDPGAVYWDTSNATRLVSRVGDTLVAIVRDLRTGEFTAQIAPHIHRIPTLRDVSAPLQSWAAACDDGWLADYLRDQATIGGTWRHAVAAGCYARLYESADPTVARGRVERFTAGRPDEQFMAPRQWVRSLDADQLRTIEDLGLAEVDALRAALELLEGRLEEDPAPWVDRWRSTRHRRDDLEGVRVLLEEAGGGARVRAALARLDRIGRRLLMNVPSGLLSRDERTRRAHLTDPTAWWADPDLKDVL